MATKGGGRAIIGFGFMAAGGVFVWGGLTGRLAPMLAALFEPQDLAPTSSSGGGLGSPTNPSSPAGQIVGGIVIPSLLP